MSQWTQSIWATKPYKVGFCALSNNLPFMNTTWAVVNWTEIKPEKSQYGNGTPRPPPRWLVSSVGFDPAQAWFQLCFFRLYFHIKVAFTTAMIYLHLHSLISCSNTWFPYIHIYLFSTQGFILTNPQKSPPPSWLVSSVCGGHHRYCRRHRYFRRLYFHFCSSSDHKCEDHLHLHYSSLFHPQLKYMISTYSLSIYPFPD